MLDVQEQAANIQEMGLPRPAPPKEGGSTTERLALLLELERRLRQAPDAEDLGFVAVNDLFALVPYAQAVLMISSGRRDRIAAISGVPSPDRNAPYVVWLRMALREFLRGKFPQPFRTLSLKDVPQSLQSSWREWLPEHAALVPLRKRSGKIFGTLFLASQTEFKDSQLKIIHRWSEVLSHAWTAISADARKHVFRLWGIPIRYMLLVGMVLLFGLSFVPTRQSVLAPAQIVPLEPFIIRSPFDGTIKEVDVTPNAEVQVGQKLFSLDDQDLQNQLVIADAALGVAQAEVSQAETRSHINRGSNTDVLRMEGTVKQREAELRYIEDKISRTQVFAPITGIVIFESKHRLLRSPVQLGGEVMTVVDPSKVRLEISLPISDYLLFERGAEVQLFLNAAPQDPVSAFIERVSYDPIAGPDGSLSYRVRALFSSSDKGKRIGLKGVAKIYGEETNLFYYVMRRPLTAARQGFGL